MDNFLDIGPFVPLAVNGQGTVMHEVAPVQFWLPRANRQNEPPLLSVALIRDLRKSVLSPPREEELLRTGWADIRHEEVAWWIARMAGDSCPGTANRAEAHAAALVSGPGEKSSGEYQA